MVLNESNYEVPIETKEKYMCSLCKHDLFFKCNENNVNKTIRIRHQNKGCYTQHYNKNHQNKISNPE